MLAMAASAFALSRRASSTRTPRFANTRAVSKPMPLFAPVTRKHLPDCGVQSETEVRLFRTHLSDGKR
ncbi:hypothetical protein ATN84_22740 [Paramesorhizobium deserti]|uniref:Uncharacterized protein n=1 Tax=Paramesorhizobium deserti TaxID=1494590 RepID=A0A135HNC4_9HYPH|nr:hypothetical protein ATN84_22740 [Paramesorhizobium deserti]